MRRLRCVGESWLKSSCDDLFGTVEDTQSIAEIPYFWTRFLFSASYFLKGAFFLGNTNWIFFFRLYYYQAKVLHHVIPFLHDIVLNTWINQTCRITILTLSSLVLETSYKTHILLNFQQHFAKHQVQHRRRKTIRNWLIITKEMESTFEISYSANYFVFHLFATVANTFQYEFWCVNATTNIFGRRHFDGYDTHKVQLEIELAVA